MGLSCKSKSAVAVCSSSTRDARHRNDKNNGAFLESFKFRDLEAATNWFSRESLILKTSHGQLYRGELPDGRVVAVKRPDVATEGANQQRDSSDAPAEAFNNEVQILSKLFSRRLVNLLGCCRDGRAKLLVLEYMENGPLHESLTDPAVILSWPMRVKLALDIAKAVRALHASSPPIVHRNIRSTNVFLDRDGNARLGDFCHATVMPDTEPPRRSVLISIPETGEEGEPRYSSATAVDEFDAENYYEESSSDSRVTPKIDVFSFGVILLEIMSGRSTATTASSSPHHPHHGVPSHLLDWALPLIKHGHSIAICDPRITPFPDNAAVRIMANVAARCVRSSSSRRPAMDEVVQCLTKASKLVPEPLWTSTSSSVATPPPGHGCPELTPISTTSRDFLSSQSTTRRSAPASTAVSRRDESLINANLDAGHTPFNGSGRSSGSLMPKKTTTKKGTLVFRLGRLLVRKLRIRRAPAPTPSYDKLQGAGGDRPRKTAAYRKSSPLKGSKVSDDQGDIPAAEVDQRDGDFGDALEFYQKKPENRSRSSDKSKTSRTAAIFSSRFAGYHSSQGSRRSGRKFVRV